MLKSYPKILACAGKYADYIIGEVCEVTEKIDGSAFVFGKDASGKLHFRSKGCAIVPEETGVQKLFQPAIDHVLSVQHLLPDNIAFYGETLASPRHNTLRYSRTPINHIMLYGMTDFERTHGSDHETLSMWAENLSIEAVPLIGHFEIQGLEQVKQYLEGESALGGAIKEGVVIKNYRVPMEYAGSVYPFVTMKYVSEQFKEVHSKNPEYMSSADKLQTLLDSYCTEARWEKTVQHLRDSGQLLGEPKDIGNLLKELNKDIIEEEKENFKDHLYQLYQKQWKSTVCRGFPEWYKQKLLTCDTSGTKE